MTKQVEKQTLQQLLQNESMVCLYIKYFSNQEAVAEFLYKENVQILTKLLNRELKSQLTKIKAKFQVHIADFKQKLALKNTFELQSVQILSNVYHWDFSSKLVTDQQMITLISDLFDFTQYFAQKVDSSRNSATLEVEARNQCLKSVESGFEALKTIYEQNKTQFFYKFKLHRDVNPNINLVAQFDNLNFKIAEMSGKSGFESAQQLLVLVEGYKEYFSPLYVKLNRIPAINGDLVFSGAAKRVLQHKSEQLLLFKEGIVSINFLKQKGAGDCVQMFMEDKTLSLYSQVVDQLNYNQTQLQQAAMRICLLLNADLELKNAICKYCTKPQLFKEFLCKLAVYQKCLNKCYLKQAFNETVIADIVRNNVIKREFILKAIQTSLTLKGLNKDEKTEVEQFLWGRQIKMAELE